MEFPRLQQPYQLGINTPALCIPADPSDKAEEVVVCFGIIDILQDYSLRKVMERRVGARAMGCAVVQSVTAAHVRFAWQCDVLVRFVGGCCAVLHTWCLLSVLNVYVRMCVSCMCI